MRAEKFALQGLKPNVTYYVLSVCLQDEQAQPRRGGQRLAQGEGRRGDREPWEMLKNETRAL